MTSSADITIWCDSDDCGEWGQGESEWNASRVRRSLAAKGWTRARRDGRMVDLCPSDSGEREETHSGAYLAARAWNGSVIERTFGGTRK